MTILPRDESLLSSDQFRFTLRCFTIDNLDNQTNVTASIIGMSIAHTEIAESVFGWQINISGKDYDRVVYATGNMFRIYREIWNGTDHFPEDLYYEGYILPGSVRVNWNSQTWDLSVVDHLTYLSNRTSPIISVSELNIASGGSTEADSYTIAEVIAGQGEFIGKPPLDPSQAVDNDIGTLWVSAKSPTFDVAVVGDTPTHPIVSEVYGWPHQSLDKKNYQWLELSRLDAVEDAKVIRLMTRSGVIELNVTFGEQYGTITNSNDEKPQFAVVCYDAALLSSAWGEAPRHCPVFEWKNAPLPTDPNSTDYGRVTGRHWGFNLDNEGDYIAIAEDKPADIQFTKGHNDIRWRTVFVENGPAMTRIIDDCLYEDYYGSDPNSLQIEGFYLSEEVGVDELVGCFVQVDPYTPPGGNMMLCIVNNEASNPVPVGGRYLTKLHCTQYWDSANYGTGTAARILPWPNSTGNGYEWPDSDGLATPTATTSYRVSEYNDPHGKAAWETDASPQIGFSGVSADDLWSWIIVEPTEMSFLLSSPIATNDFDVYLESTVGLTTSGSVYIALTGPLAYTARTDDKITLTDPYPGDDLPVGTPVYQSIDGSVNTAWPVEKIRVYRRSIPLSGTGNRVIGSLWLYGTDDPSPRPPGTPDTDGDWREDWDRLSSLDNNTTISLIEFDSKYNPFAHPWWRYKKYCLAIRAMVDDSQGRINEIYMLPPGDVSGNALENATVASFFEYALTLLGVASIDISGASEDQLSPFSTDNSKYIAVLSDMAVRTGTVLIAEPLGGIITVTLNPYWTNSPILDAETVLEREDIRDIAVQSRDDRSISQVQVTVMDGDGNMSLGRYPAIPRSDGEVYTEPRIFSSQTGNADGIARWLFFQRVAATLSLTVSGSAPWGISGKQLLGIYWTGDLQGVDINRYWHVTSVEQNIRFGTRDAQALWQTVFSLRDARQWQ